MDSSPETNWLMFFVLKYFLPGLLFVGSGAIIVSGHPSISITPYRLLLQAPLLLWGMFLLTVSEVRACHDHLKYRRFYLWHEIPYDFIQRCEVSLHPGLAFIVPKGSQRRIYFVVLRPAFEQSARLVKEVNERLSGYRPKEHPNAGRDHDGNIWPRALCLIMCVGGITYGIFISLRFPEAFLKSKWAGFPHWVSLLMTSLMLLQQWPWIVLVAALLLAAIVRLRFRKRSWALAIVFGTLIGRLMVEIWR